MFERPGGGSNGYDREDNYQRSLAYNTGKMEKDYLYFTKDIDKIVSTSKKHINNKKKTKQDWS